MWCFVSSAGLYCLFPGWNAPLYAQLFKPSTYVYLMLALTLLLLYRRERRWALCTLPVWAAAATAFW